MKVLIYLTGGTHWIGGVQYTRNLLRAVSLLPAQERPALVLQIGRKNTGQGYEEEFSHYPGVVIDGPLERGSAIRSRILDLARRAWKRSTGKDLRQKLLRSDECDVAFPAKGPNIPGLAQKVYWVPDFQYKHFPQFFSEDERRSRDAFYGKMFDESGILVLSSEAVEADFLRFFPTYSQKPVRILHFSSTLHDEDYALDPIAVCAKHGLPEKFVYLPNQMWQHKGFDAAFRALGILKRAGVIIPLVLTGSSEDYRSNDYARQLEEILTEYDLQDQIYRLGVLPRSEQLQLFRRAAVVLQPSRFEGWSTTVEDTRALGRPIVLSNIDVHLEQAPPNASYFVAGDQNDLADKLGKAWLTSEAGPDFKQEDAARKAANLNSLAYARTFLSIMRQAHRETDPADTQ
ncbi:glycosyltransferase [Rhizobium leguminosarum]|uniref:glycosyltransferase n=1 Tax=Rhizobium leguminosarum TaxID=384 RepID=UPI0015FD8E2E|nr:glycosyltransferase [Rhizobium leguminosarum]MBA9031434.1 glycosyltransferase involved in cell wall biosynthesis [Rhizobium leguminosarum]